MYDSIENRGEQRSSGLAGGVLAGDNFTFRISAFSGDTLSRRHFTRGRAGRRRIFVRPPVSMRCQFGVRDVGDYEQLVVGVGRSVGASAGAVWAAGVTRARQLAAAAARRRHGAVWGGSAARPAGMRAPPATTGHVSGLRAGRGARTTANRTPPGISPCPVQSTNPHSDLMSTNNSKRCPLSQVGIFFERRAARSAPVGHELCGQSDVTNIGRRPVARHDVIRQTGASRRGPPSGAWCATVGGVVAARPAAPWPATGRGTPNGLQSCPLREGPHGGPRRHLSIINRPEHRDVSPSPRRVAQGSVCPLAGPEPRSQRGPGPLNE